MKLFLFTITDHRTYAHSVHCMHVHSIHRMYVHSIHRMYVYPVHRTCVHFVLPGDAVAGRSKLDDFKGLDYSFPSSREGEFLEKLLAVSTPQLFRTCFNDYDGNTIFKLTVENRRFLALNLFYYFV